MESDVSTRGTRERSRDPELIAEHVDAFLSVLSSSNNRLVWGALTALDSVVSERTETILSRLPEITVAAQKGSVIARDRWVSILCQLTEAGHGRQTVPTLLDALETSAVNQPPMYAEQVAEVVPTRRAGELGELLRRRLEEVEQPSKRKRIERVLRRLENSQPSEPARAYFGPLADCRG